MRGTTPFRYIYLNTNRYGVLVYVILIFLIFCSLKGCEIYAILLFYPLDK